MRFKLDIFHVEQDIINHLMKQKGVKTAYWHKGELFVDVEPGITPAYTMHLKDCWIGFSALPMPERGGEQDA
jgi:hypothetical protein